MELTLKQYAQQAIDVQDACNSRGVARSLVQAMDAIDKFEGLGTRNINRHPIVFMFLYKLMALNGHEPLNLDAEYRDAEAKCKAIAGGDAPLPSDVLTGTGGSAIAGGQAVAGG